MKKTFQEGEKKESQGKSDACCRVPSLEEHQSPKPVLPACCRKVQASAPRVHRTERYLQQLHFPDNVSQEQLPLGWHEGGHLQTTDPCPMTSTICCSLSRNTPGITQLKHQSAVNYHTDRMSGVKSHSCCWFSQFGSHGTWTCPQPRWGQRPVPLHSLGWVLFAISLLTPLSQQRVQLT